MPVFRYKGFHRDGKAVSGMKDAENERALRAALRREGIMPTEVKGADGTSPSAQKKAAGSPTLLEEWVLRLNTIGDGSAQVVSILTRQLATLLKAGVQLSEALAALIEQTERTGLKQVLADVRTQINEGRSFSYALSRHKRIFSELYINMTAVGEASGTLDSVLTKLADFLESQHKLKSKVTSALMYPLVMLVLGSGIMWVLMTSVVPKVTSVFEDSGKALPWNTQLLISASSFISDYSWILFPGLIGCILLFLQWKRTASGRKTWDRIILKIWVIGPLIRTIAMSRFASTSATMLAAGLPLLKALEIVGDVLGNKVLTQVVANARESIREGESIAQPLKRSGEFPSLLCHMIAIGEKSGQLETMLNNVAVAYELEVETKMARMTSLLEPLMIAGMGISVGFVVVSILGPIQEMGNVAF